MQSDVLGTIAPDGSISHVTGGNFARVQLLLMDGYVISYGHKLHK
jgi:hypothetical protein